VGKFVFVTGGVLSGVGKGVTAAALGAVLKARGYRIFIQKFDQYINVDAGTLNPHEHGEVFVTDDGAETDLDLGHYERFTDENLTQDSSIMTGRIYADVIAKERAGEFLGKTVQVIPHITNEIKNRMFESQKKFKADISIVEIGGTVGDYEGSHFLEAARQMKKDAGAENVIYFHIAYLPFLQTSRELKTKPAQNSIRDLRDLGIIPDFIGVRADFPITRDSLLKIALFGGVEEDAVVPLETINCVYKVPMVLERNDIAAKILKKLNLPVKKPNLTNWLNLISKIDAEKPELTIGLVGKYMGMADTYLSVTEAIKAAAWHHNVNINIKWVDSEQIERDGTSLFADLAGIVIPGGFGGRGIEGKILAAQFALDRKIPYLGLCLGMQIATIAFARRALKSNEVNSEEFDPKVKHPVIHIMEHQKKITEKGGTMRLGAYPCVLRKDSFSYRAYQAKNISERHRHRFEFNNKYRKILEQAGLRIAGVSPDNKLVEIIEVKNHPWFVGVQFHPEFKSRPYRPHPLFRDFIGACIKTSTLPLK
jgi:CTP synthase